MNFHIHDFTPKNLFFFNYRGGGGGGGRNFGVISCEKSRFYAKKIIFFPILGGGGGRAGCAPEYYMNSHDSHIDTRGKELLDMCISNQLRILNGRTFGDSFGAYTCYKPAVVV